MKKILEYRACIKELEEVKEDDERYPVAIHMIDTLKIIIADRIIKVIDEGNIKGLIINIIA